jgi:hypothetical protein
MIRKNRPEYNNNTPVTVCFMTVVDSTLSSTERVKVNFSRPLVHFYCEVPRSLFTSICSKITRREPNLSVFIFTPHDTLDIQSGSHGTQKNKVEITSCRPSGSTTNETTMEFYQYLLESKSLKFHEFHDLS